MLNVVIIGMVLVAVLITFAFTRRHRGFSFVTGLIFTSLLFAPRSVFSFGEGSGRHVGITADVISIRTYTIAIVVALIVAVASGWIRSFPLGFTFFIFYSVVCAVLAWPRSTEASAGLFHILVGILAAPVGAAIFQYVRAHPDAILVVVRWIFFFFVIQFAIAILQQVGIPLFPTDQFTELYEGARARGTFGHPSTAGKFVVLCLVFLLPATNVATVSVRRLAWWSTVLGFALIVLTQSRANVAAIIVAIVLWLAFTPGRRRWIRLMLVSSSIVIAMLLTADIWLWRIANGEDGELRAYLLGVGLRQVANGPVFGVGPNSYVSTVAQYDWSAAAGWPVHNVFVLMAAELGVAGAVLLFGPLAVQLLRCIFWPPSSPGARDVTRAAIVTTPGILFIALTGWGLMNETFPLWMLCYGYIWAATKTRDTVPPSQQAAAGTSRHARPFLSQSSGMRASSVP